MPHIDHDPNIGRFTSPDPSCQEKNPYLYAEGDSHRTGRRSTDCVARDEGLAAALSAERAGRWAYGAGVLLSGGIDPAGQTKLVDSIVGSGMNVHRDRAGKRITLFRRVSADLSVELALHLRLVWGQSPVRIWWQFKRVCVGCQDAFPIDDDRIVVARLAKFGQNFWLVPLPRQHTLPQRVGPLLQGVLHVAHDSHTDRVPDET